MAQRRRERQFSTGIGNVLLTKTLGKYLIPFRLRNPAYCVWAPKRDKAHLQHLRERKRMRMVINSREERIIEVSIFDAYCQVCHDAVGCKIQIAFVS